MAYYDLTITDYSKKYLLNVLVLNLNVKEKISQF